MFKEQIKAFKQELILQKVSELLEKEGFDRLKMADVAKVCGISVGALYKIFHSKDELFYAYVTYQIELFDQKLTQLFLQHKKPLDRIRAFIELKFATFKQKQKVLQDTLAADPLFFAKLNVTKKNPAKKIYHRLAKELERAGIVSGLQYAYLLNGLTLGYIEMWLAGDGELDAKEAFEHFLKILPKE